MTEFSWNACLYVENEWKVHPIFLHTDKMERIASRLIFGLSSSLYDRISVRVRLIAIISTSIWASDMDKYIATFMCGRLHKQ